MRRSFGLVLLLPLWSCADALKDAQTLEEPRVLGVRLATADDQASPPPGQDAAFEVLLAGPGGTLDARLAYQLCRAESSTRGVPFCAGPALAEGTVPLDGTSIPLAIPGDLASGAPLALLAVACLTSEPRLNKEPLDWRCAGDEPALRFSFDARAGGSDFSNRNPDLAELTVSLDGSDVALDELRAPASCDGDAPTIGANAIHRVAISLGASAREPNDGSSDTALEALQLSHFSTGGSFERQFSFVDADQPAEAALTWRAPAAGVPVKQYLVVRDGRGGVSWTSWSVCTR